MARVRRTSRVVGVGLISMLLVIVSVATVALWPLIVTRTGLRTANAPATVPASVFAPTPQASGTSPKGSGVVASAAPLAESAPLDADSLATRIDNVPRGAIQLTGGVVLDAESGEVLYDTGGDNLMIPASNLKTLTALAVLDALGPQHRFATRVMQTGPSTIVLVGGGDPYLASKPATRYPALPSIDTLVTQTAAELKAAGVTTVSLGYDDTLFSGPDWNPAWPASYGDQVTRISALWVDEGLTDPARSVRPAADATAIFAEKLRAAGITVTLAGAIPVAGASTGPSASSGGSATSGPSGSPTGSIPSSAPGSAAATSAAPSGSAAATELARLDSLPLETIVQTAMLHSDNSATEVLFRHLGLAAGEPGSFVGGAVALQAYLQGAGLWQQGAKISDGCGLSRENLVSPMMLARAWHLAASQPRTAVLLSGLPVSGATGTLGTRYNDPKTDAGRGYVHAKTGTLTHVSALSGWAVARQGAVAHFAFIVNNGETGNDWAARVWLDSVTTAISGCGCTS